MNKKYSKPTSSGYQGHNPRPMSGGGFRAPVKRSFSGGNFRGPVRNSGNRGNGGGRAFGAQNIHFSKFINKAQPAAEDVAYLL